MEELLQKSPQLRYPIDSDDAKHVSGLSTILVATIQEAKDWISQIEYIFCSQLFPNFQSKSKSLQKIYSDARKAAEDTWKKKENNLLFLIDNLKLEKQFALEENQTLKLENAKRLTEQGENRNVFLFKQKSLEKKVRDLEWELQQRSKEIDEGMELRNELLQLVQSKASVIVNRGKQLKEQEEKENVLLAKLRSLEKKVDELQEELAEMTEEIAKGKEFQEHLVNRIALQASKIMNGEQVLIDHLKEKKLLTAKLDCPEENVDVLQKELRKKDDEVEKGKKLREQLLQQINLNGSEMLKNEQQLEEREKEKKLPQAKIKGLEEKVEELLVDLRERSGEVPEVRESYEKLLQCIESNASELMSEKNKTRHVIAAYKRLKSQYNFVCRKLDLTMENMPSQNEVEEAIHSMRHHQNPLTSPENKNPDTSSVACDTIKPKDGISFQEKSDNEKGVRLIRPSSSHSPSFTSSGAPKCPTESKSAPRAGIKWPASHWRDTRSRQCQGGPDPHDDFLDTPFENVRGNSNKAMKEEIPDLPVWVPKDMNFDSSDDETQDLNVASCSQKPEMPVPRTTTRGYKCVEPLRKKAERENLKGIECKQCKKFYDAVLPNGGGKDADGNKQNFRCEHHDGVSRHRYRYVPPLTPEGFWNIGFDSEM